MEKKKQMICLAMSGSWLKLWRGYCYRLKLLNIKGHTDQEIINTSRFVMKISLNISLILLEFSFIFYFF